MSAQNLYLARRRILTARPLGMYYIQGTTGLESLKAHTSEITLLAPQSFFVGADGIVRGNIPKKVADVARTANLPMMPLVVNRNFNRSVVSKLLRSTILQDRAAAYLAYLAKRNGYVGFQIDFENIDPADKSRLTHFVERAATKLHREGRLLSVAVVPRFSDTFPGRSPSGEFATTKWSSGYDYQGLARFADFLTLMTYDQHYTGPPGPIAGMAWVKEALQYALSRVPPSKLLLGIPLYGREWVKSGQSTTAHSLSLPKAQSLLEQLGIQEQWDEHWLSPWFRYREGSSSYTVWFENHRSISEKLRLVEKHHLRGFAAWRLGMENLQFWNSALVTGGNLPDHSLPQRRSLASKEAAEKR